MSVYVRQNAIASRFEDNANWVVLNEIEMQIRDKMLQQGTPLQRWNLKINYGVKTALNAAFIISGAQKDELIAQDPKSAELIRPILEGKRMYRYHYRDAEQFLIATHNGYQDGNQPVPPVPIDNYPAVKDWLDNFEPKLSTRSDQGVTAYHLRDCAYWESFNQPKIVWGNLNLNAAYSLAEAGIVINAPATMITPASKYLLGILNSKLADHYIRRLGVTRNGGYFEYKPMFVSHLPVPKKIDAEAPEFVELVNKRLTESSPVEQLRIEALIDAEVYRLYELTPTEIDFIEADAIS